MKFTSLALPQLLSALKQGKIKGLVIYGPDKGMISFSCNAIAKSLEKNIETLTYQELLTGGLDITLNNASLFGDSNIIKITNMPTSIDVNLKNILLAGPRHIPILIADELSPASSLRKFFETEEQFAALACYNEDENNIRKIVASKVVAGGRSISSDAIAYIAHHLIGDRYIIENELEKLLLFTYDKTNITLNDVEKVISASIVASPDMLCISFAKGDAKRYFTESARLLAENISIVWIIRALIRYYINLYIVSSMIEGGTSVETAISSLKPPIFFKYLQDFKAILSKTSKQKIIYILSELNKAEKESKSSSYSAENICDNLFFRSHGK